MPPLVLWGTRLAAQVCIGRRVTVALAVVLALVLVLVLLLVLLLVLVLVLLTALVLLVSRRRNASPAPMAQSRLRFHCPQPAQPATLVSSPLTASAAQTARWAFTQLQGTISARNRLLGPTRQLPWAAVRLQPAKPQAIAFAQQARLILSLEPLRVPFAG